MNDINSFPQTLTIAGTDSGGGAGIMADMKTMQECGVFSTAVVVAVTAQNTIGVQDFQALSPKMINEQFDSIHDDFEIKACKTGMLADAEHVELVYNNLNKYDFGPFVLDPVMIAKGGAQLISDEGIDLIKTKLIKLATLVTPNMPEAEALIGSKIESQSGMLVAAKKIQKLGAKNVLIKGGHGDSEMVRDIVLLENGDSFWMNSKRVHTVRTHGTGDTISSAIVSRLALGDSMKDAILFGKDFVEAAIKNTIQVGHGHGPLNHWAYNKEHDKDEV
ncbi:bifunctional hydroxymethylpyrimidine kinase/phosphomethylpyrimidine kinase [Companilactobacillus sp.]|jgi:hydroxymethylpyrimidine/phosphomethylpyrimidine kinase|uniref:bifunctional hydroxymethylpyrimidine kinase/phosphomethylpyrimidine kinase n=1 Tax=Companilactobacillus sp. TaxID=2767905 RepID=UPI0025C40CAC|nr:bifunctional hydroxymethylpyrimidine kinase/phosphomethylpyrimidine kinase [Companilactobacillus sp.]MCH4010005.1 bifunctional hydroxymethylpyrimidine kinase/phosphomethylpyrimidine kinase [Companilactobacillus sp.]MCH4052319.1 bifunctional hydroxymethylpyrimidine kinase/phosphomethylpyrimidine kinase [Companilactobacillus sp.]MCH4077947.1 bifunctional hydroxymethylpyrimidine kinase/phosphomethylpyrimidine kinase [Companilactobacillus sp.]MCH4126523.1 bifunctional hydroxymethylpyrimidine kin